MRKVATLEPDPPLQGIGFRKGFMLQRCAAFAGWALLGYIALATLGPIEARPTLYTPPVYERMAAFFLLGSLFRVAYPQRGISFLIVVGSAVMLELAQLVTPDRHGRFLDLFEKVAGGVAGILIGHIVVLFSGLRSQNE
jgi:hypothetical protein